MESIKNVLHSVLGDIEKKQKNSVFQKAISAWEKIAGSKICAHTKIVYLTKDKIRINVDSPAWLYEMNLKKGHIQKEFSRHLKNKEIEFRLGSIQ